MVPLPRSSFFVFLLSLFHHLCSALVAPFVVQRRYAVIAVKWKCYCFLQRQPSPCPPFTQVISDVDDTIKSSGGVKIGDVALGGIDTQYERGEFYPG
jgi:hypothetical protein